MCVTIPFLDMSAERPDFIVWFQGDRMTEDSLGDPIHIGVPLLVVSHHGHAAKVCVGTERQLLGFVLLMLLEVPVKHDVAGRRMREHAEVDGKIAPEWPFEEGLAGRLVKRLWSTVFGVVILTLMLGHCMSTAKSTMAQAAYKRVHEDIKPINGWAAGRSGVGEANIVHDAVKLFKNISEIVGYVANMVKTSEMASNPRPTDRAPAIEASNASVGRVNIDAQTDKLG